METPREAEWTFLYILEYLYKPHTVLYICLSDRKIIDSLHSVEDRRQKCNCSLGPQKIQYSRCVGGWNCTMLSTFPFKPLHMAETMWRAGIIAQIVAARDLDLVLTRMWVQRGWKAPSCRSQSLPAWLWHRGCPAAVRAGWCKGIRAPRPLLVSAVINSSIFLLGTCTPSLIFLIVKTITLSLFHFW